MWRALWIAIPWPAISVVRLGSRVASYAGFSLPSWAWASALIPHTLEITSLGTRRVGDRVNIETDILAKYVVCGR